ncbi:MAG: rod shape-determining protein MreC [Gammaproteobacteria bacterium]|nr:rod shape-determining protein MreC [Gammaproteobacteria bacterium]
MQPLFQQSPGITLRLILLGALSVSVMTLDHRFDHLRLVREQIGLVIYPLQILVDMPARLGTWGATALSSRTTLLRENERLRSDRTLMQAQLQKMVALETENTRLRDLLGSSSKVANSVLVAELLAVDLDPYRQQVLINKGARHAVYAGQPVIDASGVMGQIIHAGTFTSTALLISDPSHALPVQVDRTGLRTIVTGTGSPDRLELRFIPATADIEVNDAVFTSGLGGRFPPNYPVAVVSSVERRQGQAFARVYATPTARLDRSREVLLVWHQPESVPASSESE